MNVNEDPELWWGIYNNETEEEEYSFDIARTCDLFCSLSCAINQEENWAWQQFPVNWQVRKEKFLDMAEEDLLNCFRRVYLPEVRVCLEDQLDRIWLEDEEDEEEDNKLRKYLVFIEDQMGRVQHAIFYVNRLKELPPNCVVGM